MFFRNLFRSFGMGLRILKNTLLRPFRALYFRAKRSTNVSRKVAAKAPELGKAVRKVKLKPKVKDDYVETKNSYVAKSLIIVAVLVAVGVGLLVYFIGWPAMRSWWFTAGFWEQNEAVAAYNGRVRLYEDPQKDTLVFHGRLQEGKKTGEGTLYYENGNPLYQGGFLEDLYQGRGTLYNADNTLLYQGAFADGLYEGMGKEYENGILVYEGGFSQGVRSGKGTLYDEQGNARYVGTFANGEMEGEGAFYENGTLLYKGGVSAGEYSGTGKEYHADGVTVACAGNYFAGLRAGYGVTYYENGTPCYQGNFDMGAYSGTGTLFYENGQTRYSGGFLLGEFSGEGASFSEQGARLYKGSFERGLYNGTGTRYDEAGRTVYTGEFVDGLYQGEGVLSMDAQRRIEGTFEQNVLVGAARLYINGLLYYEGTFENGLMHGEGTRFAPGGRTLYQGRFQNGTIDGSTLMDLPLEDARALFGEALTRDIELPTGLLVRVDELGICLFASYQTPTQAPVIHRLYQYDMSGIPLTADAYPAPPGTQFAPTGRSLDAQIATQLTLSPQHAVVAQLPGCTLHVYAAAEQGQLLLVRYMSKTPLPQDGIPPSVLAAQAAQPAQPAEEPPAEE